MTHVTRTPIPPRQGVRRRMLAAAALIGAAALLVACAADPGTDPTRAPSSPPVASSPPATSAPPATTATADPQPSEVPDSPGPAPEPTAIPAEQLPDVMTAIDPMQDPAVAVHWIEPGASLAVLLGGSGTEQCVPQPIGATSTGPGTIEVAFEYPSGDMDCSADLRLYGWQLPLAEAVSATLPVEVTVTGAAAEGATAEITLEPGDILELG